MSLKYFYYDITIARDRVGQSKKKSPVLFSQSKGRNKVRYVMYVQYLRLRACSGRFEKPSVLPFNEVLYRTMRKVILFHFLNTENQIN